MTLEHGRLKPSFSLTEPKVETNIRIKRFSPEQKKALEKQGFIIHELTGQQSIKSLRGSGRKFRTTWHKGLPGFEALTSIRSEVAINPNLLFLPNSNRKNLKDQEKMVEEFSKKLGRQISGIKAIIGDVADYVELAFQHLAATKGQEYLFGKKYEYGCARTKTNTSGSNVADVGNFSAVDGLGVNRWPADNGSADLWVSPLVVPAK